MTRLANVARQIARFVGAHRLGFSLFVVCIFSFATYSPLLFGSFLHFDDGQQIFDNLKVKDLTWNHFADALFTNYTGKGSAPSFAVSLLNWAVTPNYMGFAAVNLTFFMGFVLLFYRFTALFIGDTVARVAATLLFATHSLNTDSLGWMSSRCHIMGATFIVLTFVFWQKYRDDLSASNRRMFYILAVLSAAIAVWNKGIFVVVPGLIGLYDLYRKRRFGWLFFLDKLPLAAISVVPFLFTPLKWGTSKLMRPGIGPSLDVTLLNDAGLFLQYLYHLIVPGPTAVSIDVYPVQTLFEVSELSSLIFLRMPPVFNLAVIALLLVTLIYRYFRCRCRLGLYVFGFILVSLSPVMNIPPRWVDFGFRFEMMPLLFFCVGVGSLVSYLRMRLNRRYRVVAIVCFALFILGHSSAAFRHARNWDTELSYWLACTQNFPDSIVCRNKSVWLLENKGRLDEAIVHMREVHEYMTVRRPNRPRPAAKDLAALYRKAGKIDAAIFFFERSLFTDPLNAKDKSWVREQLKTLKEQQTRQL